MGLPTAFEMAGLELPDGNPAVGFLREHAVIGFLKSEFGANEIQLSEAGNKRGFDVVVCDKKLSIKTVNGDGEIKLLWTVDNESVDNEIRGGYIPEYDVLLIKIHWNKCQDSMFYIPLELSKKCMLMLVLHDI